MSTPGLVKTVIRSTPYLAMMGTTLIWTYLTLGQKVRKARKAFERQLVSQGMSKKDARRLSECYNELKRNIDRMLFSGLTIGSHQ